MHGVTSRKESVSYGTARAHARAYGDRSSRTFWDKGAASCKATLQIASRFFLCCAAGSSTCIRVGRETRCIVLTTFPQPLHLPATRRVPERKRGITTLRKRRSRNSYRIHAHGPHASQKRNANCGSYNSAPMATVAADASGQATQAECVACQCSPRCRDTSRAHLIRADESESRRRVLDGGVN
jgi:hypothetical protein